MKALWGRADSFSFFPGFVTYRFRKVLKKEERLEYISWTREHRYMPCHFFFLFFLIHVFFFHSVDVQRNKKEENIIIPWFLLVFYYYEFESDVFSFGSACFQYYPVFDFYRWTRGNFTISFFFLLNVKYVRIWHKFFNYIKSYKCLNFLSLWKKLNI